jgi:hypothetical protein
MRRTLPRRACKPMNPTRFSSRPVTAPSAPTSRSGLRARWRSSSTAEPDRRPLRAKIDKLEAHIRDLNEERAELRRHVASTTDGTSVAPTAQRGEASDQTDEGMERLPVPITTRPVLVPRVSAAATNALGTVPRHVAATAIRAIGGLAAGDAPVWHAVKQATGLSRQVLMTRIGIHHRLLFRADDGALDVLDLVTRESLLTTLKRLRS